MKSRGGKSQRREEKRREEKRREGKRREEKRRDETRRDETRRDETRREEKRREETKKEERRKKIKKIKSQKKADPGARKGRKVAKHCVFPMICGSGGSKTRLAKAAGAEPAGQIRDEKLHAVVARNTFASAKAKKTSRSDHFWKFRCRKSARRCAAKHMSKSKCTKHTTSGGFVTFPKTMAGVGHLTKICKDAFSVAGAVQEMLGGPGADFLRGIAFWSIRSSGLLR